MKRNQLTIKDIARAFKVSASTVSRALNNNLNISSEKRKLIQDFAKEHKYRPNSLALNLRNNHSNIIGVVVPELANQFFSSILSGMEELAETEEYQLIVCQSMEEYYKEVKCIQTLIKARVCGVLISQAKTTQKYDHIQELIDDNIPVVFFDRICTGIATEKVVVDDYSGTLKAVEHMIQSGCKKIAFFSAPLHLEISKNRCNGYLDSLRKHHIPVDKTLIRIADTQELAYLEAIKVLKSTNIPDAFMAMNDYTASGILLAAQELGFNIPADISICGFSNNTLALFTNPKLSTVDQFPKEVGRAAMALMIEKLKNPESPNIKNKIIKTALILRGSTKSRPQ